MKLIKFNKLKIVHEACEIFNRKFKNKYLAHYFLYYDTYEILIYNLTDNTFYKAIVRKETTKEQLLKGLYCIVEGDKQWQQKEEVQ